MLRQLARTALAVEGALVGVLILRPAAQALGLQEARRACPQLFDGHAAAEAVTASLAQDGYL